LGPASLTLFVVYGDAIYARGLQASLSELPEVHEVHWIHDVAEASGLTGLRQEDIILLDYELPGAAEFARELGGASGPRVLLCTRRSWNDGLATAVGGAAGALSAERLTPEIVAVAVRAISSGVGVLGIDLLHELGRDHMASLPRRSTDAGRAEHLSPREHAVLSLVAEGVPSREIAHRLAYSERTVKNVLHDVLTKLHARSRSHAVAMAVREGII
jgi:DNA-binding NarL/FixJ family response regulator